MSPLLINFAVEYAIMRVQVNQEDLKLNCIYQLLINADDGNILGKSIHTIKKNTKALVVANKEMGLEVNAGKTKYMVMSQDENAGQNHNMRIDSMPHERVEQLKYLGATLINQNSMQEEIKRRSKSGNAVCHSVQSVLFSSLLSKNMNNKIYRTIILSVVLYNCETWLLTLNEEHRLRDVLSTGF